MSNPRINAQRARVRLPVTLPKNLMLRPDVALEGFENAADWTGGAGSTVADNTTEYQVGTQGIKLTTPSGGTGQMTKTVSWAGIDYEFFEFWFYNHGTDPTSITFSVSSTTDFSKSFSWTIQVDPNNGNLYAWPVTQTWMLYRVPLAHMTNTGGESWANTMIRVRFEVVSASGAKSTTFDGLAGGYKRIPALLLYHDDGWINVYTTLFPHMAKLGLRGTVYVTCGTQKAGAGTTTMTNAQLLALHNAGWDIASHGYGDRATATGMGDLTEAQQEYQIGASQLYLKYIAGCVGNERHYSFNGTPVVMNSTDSEPALTAASALTCRGGYGALNRPAYMPPGNWYNIPHVGWTPANCQTNLDDMIAHGQFCMVGWDQVGAGQTWTVDQYNSFMNYIAGKVNAGLLQVITIDELYRLTQGSVTIGPGQQPEAASAWTLPALAVDCDFEENNLDEWEWVYDTASGLSVAAGAAMNGSNYGLNVHMDGTTTNRYLQNAFLLPTETDVCVRFYLDVNSHTLAGMPVIFNLNRAKGGYRGVAVYMYYSSGNYALKVGAAPENGTVTWSSGFYITDAPHRIEVVLHRASADGVADGWAKIYVDGTLKATVADVANYNLFRALDRIIIGGTTGLNASSSGDYFIDEVKMNRTGELIGA